MERKKKERTKSSLKNRGKSIVLKKDKESCDKRNKKELKLKSDSKNLFKSKQSKGKVMKKIQKALPRTLTKKIAKTRVTNPDKKVPYRPSSVSIQKNLYVVLIMMTLCLMP